MPRMIPVAALALCAAAIVGAQPGGIGARIAAAREGDVRFTYATRGGICGDGRRTIRFEDMLFFPTSRGFSMATGSFHSDAPCRPGLAEAQLTLAGGRVIALRSRVPATEAGEGRDLGRVAAPEAARFFLGLVGAPEVDDQRVLLALLLADSARVWPELVRLAGRTSLPEETRARVLHWAGYERDPAAREPIAAFLQGRAQPRRMREGAAVGLARLEDAAATRTLLDVVRSDDEPKLRAKIVHLLDEDPVAMPAFRTLAADASMPDDVRGAVFLVLGESEEPSDGRLLRGLLPTVASSRRLRDRLLHAVSEREDLESARWLLSVAGDRSHDVETRKKALFWAGQSDALPIAELTRTYATLDNRTLREHLIFVLHDRDEPAATDKLIEIARNDADRDLRKKAIFWLGQRDDAKSAKFLRELVSQ